LAPKRPLFLRQNVSTALHKTNAVVQQWWEFGAKLSKKKSGSGAKFSSLFRKMQCNIYHVQLALKAAKTPKKDMNNLNLAGMYFIL
jgi:hypothetical protein